MRIVQSGDGPATFEVDDFGVRSALVLLCVIHTHDTAVFDSDVCRFGIARIECGDVAIVKNQVNRR